jgi:hypothetical protein
MTPRPLYSVIEDPSLTSAQKRRVNKSKKRTKKFAESAAGKTDDKTRLIKYKSRDSRVVNSGFVNSIKKKYDSKDGLTKKQVKMIMKKNTKPDVVVFDVAGTTGEEKRKKQKRSRGESRAPSAWAAHLKSYFTPGVQYSKEDFGDIVKEASKEYKKPEKKAKKVKEVVPKRFVKRKGYRMPDEPEESIEPTARRFVKRKGYLMTDE